MNKLKIFLTLLTVAITVIPIASVVLAYQDNLLGLVIPPEVMNMANGSSSVVNSQFQPPQSVGDPQYNPETKTATFTFNFTNPLSTPITINTLEAGIVSHDDGTFLGNVSIDKPLILAPGQTADITALGKLSDQAINQIERLHPSQNYINIDFSNLNVDMAGVKIQVDRQNIGNIPIPPQLLG